MLLSEAKEIRKKNGYIIEKACSILNESPLVDLNDEEYEHIMNRRKVIEVESIDENNYQDYIGKTVIVKR